VIDDDAIVCGLCGEDPMRCDCDDDFGGLAVHLTVRSEYLRKLRGLGPKRERQQTTSNERRSA
jgi:hypothetical protein